MEASLGVSTVIGRYICTAGWQRRTIIVGWRREARRAGKHSVSTNGSAIFDGREHVCHHTRSSRLAPRQCRTRTDDPDGKPFDWSMWQKTDPMPVEHSLAVDTDR